LLNWLILTNGASNTTPSSLAIFKKSAILKIYFIIEVDKEVSLVPFLFERILAAWHTILKQMNFFYKLLEI
jgi:hypothetical protein